MYGVQVQCDRLVATLVSPCNDLESIQPSIHTYLYMTTSCQLGKLTTFDYTTYVNFPYMHALLNKEIFTFYGRSQISI